MGNNIFDKNYSDYLEQIQINEDMINISDLDDIDDFIAQYSQDISDLFQKGEYAFNDDGKIRSIKDFFRNKNLSINFENDLDWTDIIDDIDWGSKDADTEFAISKLENLMEKMQDFITEYRENDPFMPNMLNVVNGLIQDLNDIKKQIEDAVDW